MAANPSSGSLIATNNYYRYHLDSTSSHSSCGSAEYPGEAILHHLGLPEADWVTGGRASFSGSPLSIQGHSAGVPRAPTISPDLQQHDLLRPGSESHKEAAWWPAQQSQCRAPS
uniref:Uncharacterized protein n=1 Tax=Rhinolophus ferrumequinum TaxID=59479 RepID=A0A671F790_RHIFE